MACNEHWSFSGLLQQTHVWVLLLLRQPALLHPTVSHKTSWCGWLEHIHTQYSIQSRAHKLCWYVPWRARQAKWLSHLREETNSTLIQWWTKFTTQSECYPSLSNGVLVFKSAYCYQSIQNYCIYFTGLKRISEGTSLSYVNSNWLAVRMRQKKQIHTGRGPNMTTKFVLSKLSADTLKMYLITLT